MRKILLLLATVSIFYACSPSKDDDPAPYVTPQWLSVGDAVISGGSLQLNSKYKNKNDQSSGIVSAQALQGDFELKIKYSNYSRDKTANLLDMFSISLGAADDMDDSFGIVTGGVTNDKFFLVDSAKTIILEGPGVKSSTANYGELWVKRVGANYSVWLTAGTDTVYLNKNNYIGGDLKLAIVMSSLEGSGGGASISIDDVRITNSGLLKSDSFDSNTILAKFD